MKRNWNLVREILLKVGNRKPLAYSDDNDEVNYHIGLLLENHIESGDSGLILTPRGKKLFAAIQDKRVFDNAVATIQSNKFCVTEDLLLMLCDK